jgi:cytoskeletal protein CcmA (bactofilin family)
MTRMTHIGRSTVINGELTSDEELTIEGTVKGDVQVRQATLTIAEKAQVEADIHGVRVVVHGFLKGSITASTRIELGPEARVEGNLSADQVVIAEGARFDGRIDMAKRTLALKMAQYKAGQTAVRA